MADHLTDNPTGIPAVNPPVNPPENHPGNHVRSDSQGRRRVRASDEEREQVAGQMRHAMGEGRLTLDEGEQRLAEVYATTYRDELPGFTDDLPRAEPAPAAPATAPGMEPAPAGARPRAEQPRRRRPGDRLIGLLALAAVVVGGVALAGGRTLWPAIVLGILAVMLLKRRAYGRWHAPHHGRHPVDRPWHQRAER